MFEENLQIRWMLPLLHGCISIRTFSMEGATFSILLISRRSAKFAGTRFLKRGANLHGNVANEVETEQIVFDTRISSFQRFVKV